MDIFASVVVLAICLLLTAYHSRNTSTFFMALGAVCWAFYIGVFVGMAVQ